MPTPDPSNVLFQIAHPDLYERNPFNVLNLPVDATAKDIRRRKEDIEAAFDAGTEAEEFRNMLPGDDDRKAPTRAEVEELFSVLEDPEKRTAYSLFWFWPDTSETPGGRSRRSNPNGEFGHSSVIAKWEERARGSSAASSSPTVAKHNLAVFHHMMGLAYELALRKYDIKTADTPADVPQHWKAAIYWWNDVSGQADFWHAVSENVSALDDPRVDYRFARGLRDQFAFAFDQINVELAIDFAKRGRESDAKRQVKYMKLSQPDSDDVEGTIDNAFTELLHQTEVIVKAACDDAQERPNTGLHQANAILNQTHQNLCISRIVLEKGSSVRTAIVSTIFSGVRCCLIDYGNETKDWEECLQQTKALEVLAEIPSLQQQWSKDIRELMDFAEQARIMHNCWICKRAIKYEDRKESIIEVPLHGKLNPSDDRQSVNYRTVTVGVPVCTTCRERMQNCGTDVFKTAPHLLTHPSVLQAVKEGWRIGATITQASVRDCLDEARFMAVAELARNRARGRR